MAKPAARITDPTSCPMPGHGAKALAGSVVGGIAASITADSLDEELKEFSKWKVL